MYSKLFSQMYDGTLRTHAHWHVLITFQQMLILADPEGVIDMTHEAIAIRTGLPLEVIKTGIAALEAPDSGSRLQSEEGRRIVRLGDHRDWGWQIVNFGHYRDLQSNEARREYHRNFKRKQRAAQLSTVVNNVNGSATPVNNVTDADVDVDAKNPKPFGRESSLVAFQSFWEIWPDNQRKVGKVVCKKKWLTQKCEPIADEIIGHVKAMKKTAQWQEFCPAPLTYLNQRRWEDGVPPDATPARDRSKEWL